MTRTLRVGLVGAGAISQEHVDALKQLDGVELAAVCDRSAARAHELAQRCGIPRVFEALDDMLRTRELDVVHVLVPPDLHAPLARECLASGCHVFVEKPLALGRDDCIELARAAEKAGRTVGVNHNMVFSSAMRRLLAVVRSRRIGRVEHVSIVQTRPARQIASLPRNHYVFEKPENMVWEFGPHPLSLARVLVGGPKRASTIVSDEQRSRDGALHYGMWQSSFVCERGTAQCTFGFGRGNRSFTMLVHGEDGVISADFILDRIQVHEASPHRRAEAAEAADALDNALLAMSTVAAHARERLLGLVGRSQARSAMATSIASFYDALRRGAPPPEGIAEGTAVVASCEEICRQRVTPVSVHPVRGAHVAIG